MDTARYILMATAAILVLGGALISIRDFKKISAQENKSFKAYLPFIVDVSVTVILTGIILVFYYYLFVVNG